MDDPATSTIPKGLRRPPQVTLALDEDKRVLHVNKDLAGTKFQHLTNESGNFLHALIHPDCDGKCRFNMLLNRAWKSLGANRESVEWEIEDPVWKGHLRLNLTRPPTSKNVAVERRRRFALLCVTDITEIRRQYEEVLSRNRELEHRIEMLECNAAVSTDASAPLSAQRFNTRIFAAQERERRRIAADLHDGVAQTMGVVKFSVESRIAELARRYPDMDFSDLESVVDQVREAIEDLRKVSRDLSPSLLSEFGICTAIDMLCNDFGFDIPDINIVCSACVNEVSIPEPIKVAIYRIVQEALNNIGKHAKPQSVHVTLGVEDSLLVLEVRDDGDGFDLVTVKSNAERRRGLGLESMRERAELTGGNFDLQSAVDMGTAIRVTWPEELFALLRDEPVLDRE